MNIEEYDAKKEFEEEFKKLRENISDTLLTNEEYDKLIFTAITSGEIAIEYLMRVLKETGIRYSNLDELTVENLNKGEFVCIAKNAFEYTVTINKQLQDDLIEYCKDNSILTGIIFTNKNGKVFDSTYFRRKVNKLAVKAGLNKKTIGIYAFRHLFVQNIIEKEDDVLESN